MRVTDLRASLSPGSGLVGRGAAWVLAILSGATAPEADRLLSLVKRVGSVKEPGRALAQELARLMAELDPERIPDFGLLADASEGLVYVLHGNVVLSAITPQGQVEHSGKESPTWLNGFIDGEASSISLWPQGATTEPIRNTNLERGVVLAGGVHLHSVDAPPPVGTPPVTSRESTDVPELIPELPPTSDMPAGSEPSTAPEPTPPPEPKKPEPVPEGPEQAPAFSTVDLSDLAGIQREPLAILTTESTGTAAAEEGTEQEHPEDPLIEGVRCIRGHFNHPEARFCAYCGVSMVQITRQLVRGVRPPLGIFVFNDGNTFSLDADYVIGREPSMDEAVKEGQARSIALDDPEHHLSRIHVELRRDGWDVLVLDRDSANGTEIRRNGEWRRLIPGVPEVLEPGGEVRLGDHQFTFDSHHRPREA